MSEKYKFTDPHGTYFVTMAIVFWIDLFTRKDFKFMITDSLSHCQAERGLVINAWCLMPSHLHMIVKSRGSGLSDILRDFKKFTSKQVIKQMDTISESRREWLRRSFYEAGKDLKRITNYKVWQDGNHPEIITSQWFMLQKLTYIHNNPVKDCTVDTPEHYLYSSARDYAGSKGLLRVELLG